MVQSDIFKVLKMKEKREEPLRVRALQTSSESPSNIEWVIPISFTN